MFWHFLHSTPDDANRLANLFWAFFAQNGTRYGWLSDLSVYSCPLRTTRKSIISEST